MKIRFGVLIGALLCTIVSCSEYESTDFDLIFAIEHVTGMSKERLILPYAHELDKIPQDPNNPLTIEKVALGKFLFHEPGLASEAEMEHSLNTYSCASCHHAAAGFGSGNRQGIGEGGIGFGTGGEMREADLLMYTPEDLDVQPIRTPSVLNSAFTSNTLWNGQFGATGVNEGTEDQWTSGTPKARNKLGFEGVETQAIAGLDVHRLAFNTYTLMNHPEYIPLFDKAFSEVDPEDRYTDITAGLAIAAYERTITAAEAPFQQWLRGDLGSMTAAEKRGAILFFGKAECYQCHKGPSLSANEFHALGMDDLEGGNVFVHDLDDEVRLGRGGFTKNPDDNYKFKVPQLYNLRDVRFFGHGASFTSMQDLLIYKNNAIKQNEWVPHSALADEFMPLMLDEQELKDLESFILNALYDPNLNRVLPSELPSGMCFPNNDLVSQEDLGCGE